MAMADYYLCDRCGCKTFYDANLMYGGWGEKYEDMNKNPRNHSIYPDGNVGWMIVLCNDCAEAFHETIVKAEKDLQT